MTGLEKILDEIKKESNIEVQKINDEAKALAQDMIKNQEQQLKIKLADFEESLEKLVNLDLETGVSAALSQKKKIVLEEKQAIIANIIEKSKEYIKNLSKDEYISFFEKVALKYAHKQNGKIRLIQKDKDNIADELVSRINKKLLENGKGSLSIDDKVSNEKTGFVIVYDDVEENCSLEAIFSEKKELLEDKINSFLFN